MSGTIPLLPSMLVTGGICIFLIGLDISKRAFRKAVGGGLSKFMYRIGHSTILSFLFGTSLSAISQSSTAASSFSVGLVDIGMLPLESAIIVTMGASIGTVFVTLLISLDLIFWAPLMLAMSTIMSRVSRGKIERISRLMEGVSLILTGMLILKVGIEPLLSEEVIKNILLAASANPIYLGAISFALVSIIQSSPAVMAIAIALASAGILTLPSIVAIVLGSRLGSSTMVLLASLGSRVNARRLAWSNFIFRLWGILTFIPLSSYVTSFTSQLTSNMSTQVALIHISVACFNVLFGIPFFRILARLMEKIILPSREEEMGEPAFLSFSMQEFPVMAMNILAKEMIRLGSFCEELFALLLDHSGMENRIPHLRKGIRRLVKECVRFFSGIQPPGTDDYWKHEYNCISYSLAAMEELTETLSENMYELLQSQDNPLSMDSPAGEQIRQTSCVLARLITQSVGAFALGGKEMSRTAKKTWWNYLVQDKKLRARLIEKGFAGHPGEDLKVWEFLTTSNRIARAAYELARGTVIDRTPDDSVQTAHIQENLFTKEDGTWHSEEI